MTPDSFIATWKANTRNEAAGSKPHFLDLCTLLDVPPPHSDPTGTTYAFEKGVKKAAGGGGWADVCYGWPADITTDDAIARLLALNHARAAARGPASEA